MCGSNSAKVGTSDIMKTSEGGTGVDQSSASGLFVLSIEHLHAGGEVLLFVAIFALACAFVWWCATKRTRLQQQQQGDILQLQQHQQGGALVLPGREEEAATPTSVSPSTSAAASAPSWTPGWAPTT